MTLIYKCSYGVVTLFFTRQTVLHLKSCKNMYSVSVNGRKSPKNRYFLKCKFLSENFKGYRKNLIKKEK